jgi:flagellar hook-associated protein 2
MSSTASPITFNGSSTFASSFQQVITRAVGIASLPIQSLQTAVSTLSAQQSALSSLGANFSALQTSVQALATAAGGNTSLQVSDSSVLTANATSSALPGTYTIQVDDPGSSTTTLSKAGLTTVTDPSSEDISSSSTFTLTVNSVNHTITNTGTSLESLATSINAAGDGVQATIINIGSANAPDYRLSLTSANLGADTVQLNDGTNDLLDTLATGADAQYRLNGSATDIQTTSSQIALSPGLTVNLKGQSSGPVTITVSQSFTALQSALSNFVSAYNAAFDALAQNRGQNGGALTGDSVVFTMGNVLQQLSQYNSGSNTVGSLAELGITADDTGHLSFDTTAFSSASKDAISSFLGGLSSGGFLQTANNSLNFISDPVTGLIASDYNNLAQEIAADNAKISDQQSQVNTLQANLEAQLAQADAAIATLQSQKTYFEQLFTAEYGNGTGTSGG